MLFTTDTARGPERGRSMKKVMLVVAALSGSAGYAHAGEAYRDASDYRALGVMNDGSKIKLQMRDCDPFQLRMPGVPARRAALRTPSGSEAPMQTANSLPQGFMDPVPARRPGRTTLLTERSDRYQQSQRSN